MKWPVIYWNFSQSRTKRKSLSDAIAESLSRLNGCFNGLVNTDVQINTCSTGRPRKAISEDEIFEERPVLSSHKRCRQAQAAPHIHTVANNALLAAPALGLTPLSSLVAVAKTVAAAAFTNCILTKCTIRANGQLTVCLSRKSSKASWIVVASLGLI